MQRERLVPVLFCAFLLSLVGGPVTAVAEDWPAWRGPRGDGTWSESGIVASFNGPVLQPAWSVPLGPGYTGPTVASGRVYVMDRMTEPTERERVLCVDAGTGSMLWERAYDCTYRSIGYPAGPRASVVIDGDRVYALGTMGHLHCFDAASGSVLWNRDLGSDFDARIPTWGISASPLVEDDLLLLCIGGRPEACVVALDKMTGEDRWQALGDDVSYSTPIVIDQAGRRVLVAWTGQRVAGLDVDSGKLVWERSFPLKMVQGIAAPVRHGEYLFFSGFFNGSLLMKYDPETLTAEAVWQRGGENERKTDALHACMATPVLRGDHIYGVCSYGELRCLELATGRRVWEDLSAVNKARWANIHIVQNGDVSWMFNEHGELIIGRLLPEGFKEISRAKLIEPTTEQMKRKDQGVTWSHPAFADGHVFIRSDQELLCADLREKR